MKSLRREFFVLLVPIVVFGVGVTLWPRFDSSCALKTEVVMGVSGPWKTSQKTALKRLSQELKRCPNSQKFVIWRSESFFQPDRNQFAVFYDRKTRRLTDNCRDTTDVDNWENVSEHAIHAAANGGGDWAKLANFGALHAYPYG